MKDFLDYAAGKYYEGTPIISDATFDRLAEEYKYEKVGTSLFRDTVTHAYPMYSLQKVYKGEGSPPLFDFPTVITPKLDGMAISLFYIEGNLVIAATRGDGKKGKDITDHVFKLSSVPNWMEDRYFSVQIVGEVVAPKTIENARNYAAGAFGLKDLKEFSKRNLTFIAYGISPSRYPLWSQDLTHLRNLGFNTVIDRDWNEFPQDGEVWRIDDNKIFEDLGYTSHHPRGAFAYKERKEGVISKLLEVKWQVGKSGVVSPVAILEPVNIGGATVSRATLHNMKYIKELNLEIGCNVEVIRSGEIIPRVVRRVDI